MFTDVIDLMLLRYLHIRDGERYNLQTCIYLLLGASILAGGFLWLLFFVTSTFVDCAAADKIDMLLANVCLLSSKSNVTIWNNVFLLLALFIVTTLIIFVLIYLLLLIFSQARHFWTITSLFLGVMIGMLVLLSIFLPLLPAAISFNIPWMIVVFALMLLYLFLICQRMLYAVLNMPSSIGYLWSIFLISGFTMIKMVIVTRYLF